MAGSGFFSGIKHRLLSITSRQDLTRFLSVFFGICGLFGGLATYIILSGLSPINPSRQIVWFLFGLNIFMVTGLLAVVGWQLVRVWRQARRGEAGAALHGRLVFLFAGIAALPALLVAVFAIVTLDRGLDSWFSDRTKAIISNTTAVANAYLTEHRDLLRRDVTSIARDISRSIDAMNEDQRRFGVFLTAQAALRSIPHMVVIDRQGKVVQAAASNVEAKIVVPPEEVFKVADNGKPVVITVGALAQVQVLQRIGSIEPSIYLLATRFVSSNVLEHLSRTDLAVREYSEMEGRRFEAQLTFAMIYIVISLLILLSAIWIGLWLADRLAKPISGLIRATQKMGEGDLSVRVPISNDDDMGRLGSMFNDMAHRLGRQQKQLIDARDDLNERHRFTEMVLNSVRAGIIGIDESGLINHANDAAGHILRQDIKQLLGRPIIVVLPELANFFLETLNAEARVTQISRIDDTGAERLLRVSIARSRVAHGTNIVISLDDVTDLVSAQRSAAWADIARRIAHEIKNPLTPIQLSAERLRSKYLSQIDSDRDVFNQCTETIIRQVGDIGRMVDEFSSFARMPSAVIRKFNICDVIAQVLFLQRVAHPDISFKFSNPLQFDIEGDSRLLSQALTNIVKNAVESIENNKGQVPPEIIVDIWDAKGWVKIEITDSGPGWPESDRATLFEPYRTSRSDGTGLGLAIVKKIIEDHGGQINLEDTATRARDGYGAKVIIQLPIQQIVSVKQQEVKEHVG